MIMYPVQVCEKCNWVGTYEQCIREKREDTDATVFCPRCKEETVTVPLRMRLRDVLKGRLWH